MTVEYAEDLVTRVGSIAHVIGDLVDGGLPREGTRLRITVQGRAPALATLRGVDLSVRRPRVGIHLLGISASQFQTGTQIVARCESDETC